MVGHCASIAVIIPTRHEASNVERIRDRLAAALNARPWVWQLVFVDDSDDETPEVLENLAARHPEVTVIHRPRSRRPAGLGGAVLEGLAATTADFLLVMDGDLQHPPERVPDLLDPLVSGQAELVVGCRYSAGGSPGGLAGPGRRAVSLGGRTVAHACVRRTRTLHDPLGGFFAFQRSVVQGVELRPNGYKILLEIVARGRWTRAIEVPYTFSPRAAGRSKAGLREGSRFLRHVGGLALRSPAPGVRPPRVLTQVSVAAAEPSRYDGHPVSPGSRPLRILLLTSEAPPVTSGISRTVNMLSTGLRDRGHVVDVVSRADFPHYDHREFRLSAFVLFWPWFRRRLLGYDTVLLFGPAPTISEVFLALSGSLPSAHRPSIVYTHHSDLAIPGLARCCDYYNAVSDRLAHRADAVVVTSEAYRRKLTDRGHAPIHVVPWGVDAGARLLPRAAEEPDVLRVLFVGQFRPYKGLRTLLSAAAGSPWLRLTLIGDGPLRPGLQAEAARLGATNVVFRGRVSDDELWRAYSEHDVVVLPSTTTAEAYGLVLAEGMAAGCVPVASDLAGVREVAGPTGVLVRPGDVGHLRHQLQSLAADRGRLRTLREASVQRAKRSTVEDVTLRYAALFEELANRLSERQDASAVPARWSTPRAYLDAARGAVGASHASLVLFARLASARVPSGHLHPQVLWTSTGRRSRLDETPVSAFVARTRRPLLITDVPSDPRVAPLLHRSDLSSAILLPVRVQRGSVSVLALSTTVDDGRSLSSTELRSAVDLLLA